MADVTSGWGRLTWGQADWNDSTVYATGWGAKSWNDGAWGELNDQTVTLTGLSATSTVGSLTTKSDATFTLAGQALISSYGNVSIDDHSVGLTGLSASTTLGTITTTQLTNGSLVGLGLSATASVNDIFSVLAYKDIDITGNTSYSDVDITGNTSYTDVDHVA